jgi:hypothetical protein
MTLEDGAEASDSRLEDQSEAGSMDGHSLHSEETSEKILEQCPDQRQGQQSNQKLGEKLERDNGELGLHMHTEIDNPGETFEPKGSEVLVNDKESLLFDNQMNFELSPNPQAQLLGGGEPVTSEPANTAVESQTDNDSQTVLCQVESIGEIKIHGAVENGSLAGASSRAPAHPNVKAAIVVNPPNLTTIHNPTWGGHQCLCSA